MNIIIQQVRLIASPEPPFAGTRLWINVEEAASVFGIATATKATGHASIAVDWGDGTSETFTATISGATHAYANPGTYEIRITDDISAFKVGGAGGEKLLSRATSNGSAMKSLTASCFTGCTSLGEVDFSELPITVMSSSVFTGCTALRTTAGLPSGLTQLPVNTFSGCTGLERIVAIPESVRTLGVSCFRGCTSLTGRGDFPGVSIISGLTADQLPFSDCPQLSEIHFAASHMGTITGCTAYLIDNRLGAANATVYFDL